MSKKIEKKKDKEKINKSKILFRFTKNTRANFALGMIFVVFENLFSFIGPLLLALAADILIQTKDLNYPKVILWLVKISGGREELYSRIWMIAAVFIAANSLKSVFLFFRSKYMAKGSENVARNVRNNVYDHIQRLPYDYHVNAETGDLIQRCTTDVETVRRFLAVQLTEIVRVITMVVIALIILIPIDFKLTLLSMVLMPAILGASFLFFKKVEKQFTIVEETDGALSTILQEGLTGVRVVRAFGRQEYERDKYSKKNQELRDKVYVLIRYFAVFYATTDVLVVAQLLICIVLGILLAVNGEISPGQYIMFVTYVRIMIWPIRQFGRVLADLGKANIASGRLDEILSEELEKNSENPVQAPLDKDIEFKNVYFSYGETKVLKNISFSVKSGETVAILGSTGSGKSTLVQLLQRLYEIDEGDILIGDVSIKDIDKYHLRKRIGIVLQEPFLYSRTIEENIKIAEEHVDIPRVEESAKIASIHDVILSFEEGYKTVVGERGVTLSGGQKQRIAIARTVLRDSDILIFDDSLSAVDTETDAKIRKALNERKNTITTFIISHRISTLMEADRILVLEDGHIVQQGTHDTLKDVDGLYSRIWKIQASIEQEEEVN
ncbi:MAG: ABC transporter ATP-binding protein [Eubacteriales bacterium]